MKVTTSCSGRFHIYDQARELHRHGMLHRLINDYPRLISKRWDIPNEKTTVLLSHGIKARIARKLAPHLSDYFQSKVAHKLHRDFASQVAENIPGDTDIFIGLTSFSLAALKKSKMLGALAIVDHASNHLSFDYEANISEALHWGIRPIEVKYAQWAIDQENEEFREADYIFLLSNLAKKTLVSSGVNPNKIFINPCGVDMQKFYPGIKKDNVFRVVQVGSISLRKGTLYLIKAFNELNLPNSELHFVGEFENREDFKTLLRKKINNKIHFHSSIPQFKLVDFYHQCSMAVLASVSDGFGMVVPQAMACGLPVIVSDSVGAMDAISSGENGLIFRSSSLEELKEKILFLYENSDDRERIGQNAIKSISTVGGWTNYGDRLAQFLSRVKS